MHLHAPRATVLPIFSSALLTSLCAHSALAGPTWDVDLTTDAKQSAQDAQTVSTGGVVQNITGTLGGSPLVGEADLVDMYLVHIDMPMSFSMSTMGGIAGGSANFDSQLFLFRADGIPSDRRAHALLANHLAMAGSTGSFVGNHASDGSFTLDTPGLYYLAICAFGTNPYDSGNEPLWGPLNVPGVVAFGNGGVLGAWQTPGAVQGGAYTIHLSGVSGVPAPGALALLALVGLTRGRRRN